MLSCKNCCGGKKHRLFSVKDGLEHCPESHLGFAKTNVTNKKAVHDSATFHILFDVVNGFQLVGGFLIGEGVLKFLLPYGVFGIFEALLLLTFCVKFQEIDRQLFH